MINGIVTPSQIAGECSSELEYRTYSYKIIQTYIQVPVRCIDVMRFFDAAIAQLAERFICNELVPDSTSGCGSKM